jgi:hypothetical protein
MQRCCFTFYVFCLQIEFIEFMIWVRRSPGRLSFSGSKLCSPKIDSFFFVFKLVDLLDVIRNLYVYKCDLFLVGYILKWFTMTTVCYKSIIVARVQGVFLDSYLFTREFEIWFYQIFHNRYLLPIFLWHNSDHRQRGLHSSD